jgi:hypothetical protein
MNPEEIKQIRDDRQTLFNSARDEWEHTTVDDLFKALDHIDSQATQIAALKAALIKERAIQSMMRCECVHCYEGATPSNNCLENAKSELLRNEDLKAAGVTWDE